MLLHATGASTWLTYNTSRLHVENRVRLHSRLPRVAIGEEVTFFEVATLRLDEFAMRKLRVDEQDRGTARR